MKNVILKLLVTFICISSLVGVAFAIGEQKYENPITRIATFDNDYFIVNEYEHFSLNQTLELEKFKEIYVDIKDNLNVADVFLKTINQTYPFTLQEYSDVDDDFKEVKSRNLFYNRDLNDIEKSEFGWICIVYKNGEKYESPLIKFDM